MKKLAILILAVVSLFSMTACGNNGNNKDINKGIEAGRNDTPGPGPYANCDYENKDARDEAIYRSEYILHLSEEPEKLASFLLATNELDRFIEVDMEDRHKTIENAVVVFSNDKDTHQRALERAKEVFAEVHIDCNWEELRKVAPRSDDFETYDEYEAYMKQNNPILPLATNAKTGEPISSKPAGPWAGPTD